MNFDKVIKQKQMPKPKLAKQSMLRRTGKDVDQSSHLQKTMKIGNM